MNYYKVEMGNGYCGFDEEFLCEMDGKLTFQDCLEMYAYQDGGAGLNPDDEEFDSYSYEECIEDSTFWEEITEEEFIHLRDEEGWEVR